MLLDGKRADANKLSGGPPSACLSASLPVPATADGAEGDGYEQPWCRASGAGAKPRECALAGRCAWRNIIEESVRVKSTLMTDRRGEADMQRDTQRLP